MEYKLYIGKLQNTNEKYHYYDGTYMLVYSNHIPEGNWNEVPFENENKLTAPQIKWLMNCKIEINSKYISENKDTLYDVLSEVCDYLEKKVEEYKSE